MIFGGKYNIFGPKTVIRDKQRIFVNLQSVIFVEQKITSCGPVFKVKDVFLDVKLDDRVGWVKISPSINNGAAVGNFAINSLANLPIAAGQTQ